MGRANRLLVGTGFLLLGLCAAAALNRQDVLAGTLAVLGVGSIVLAVFAHRIDGTVELGPSGMKLDVTRQKAEQLSTELGRRLDESGVGLADLATGREVQNLSRKAHDDVTRLLRAIDELLDDIENSGRPVQLESGPSLTPESLFDIARGLLTERRWPEAAEMLDRYVDARPTDWEAQFVRGVAYANSRDGEKSDLAALRAYNEALALIPRDAGRDWLAKLFAYRGAMLKRLRRLEEAENDLRLAERLVRIPDQANDISYNLAAVHALAERPEEAIRLVESLAGTRFVSGIRAHADDYFQSIQNDPRFIRIVQPT